MAAHSPEVPETPFGENPDSIPSDAELVAAVRRGDNSAYAELWTRHHLAVTRYARQFGSASAADDLVSEAFARLLRVLQAGGGPDMNVRPYLLTAIRRIRIDIATRYEKRVGLTSEDAELDRKSEPARGADIEALEALEATSVWKAYNSLPERWKTVLWHTLVEEQQPAEVAPILGSTPNAVAALSMRAREGLRQAFLQVHVAETDRGECQKVLKRLGAWERRALSTREAASIEEHLADCDRCTAAAMEVGDLNRSMRVIVLPILLGGTALALKFLASLGTHSAVAAGVAAVSAGSGSGAVSAAGSTAGHAGAHGVLSKVVHITTHAAPKSLALAGTSFAVATGVLAMVAIAQPSGGKHPVALPDPVASISALTTSAAAPVPSATTQAKPIKPVVTPHPSAPQPTQPVVPTASPTSVVPSPSATRVVTVAPPLRHSTAVPAPTVKSSTTTPSTQPSASPSSSAAPSSSPSSSPSASPSSSPSTSPSPSEPAEPTSVELQIPLDFPAPANGGLVTVTVSGPSNWTINSLNGVDPNHCRITVPATVACALHAITTGANDGFLRVMASSPHPMSGDIATINYTLGSTAMSWTVALD